MESSEFAEILAVLIKKHGGEERGNQAYVAKQLGIDAQRIGQYLQGRQMPKQDFFLKWKQVFGEDILQLYKTNVYQNMDDMTKSDPSKGVPESIYKDLVEANSEYRLVPKTILQEEYRIMLLSELQDQKALRDKALESKDNLIAVLQNRIAELNEQISKLEGLQLKSK